VGQEEELVALVPSEFRERMAGITEEQHALWVQAAARPGTKEFLTVAQVGVLSIAANNAHQVTWCRIQKPCTYSGEGQWDTGGARG
jgi:hypothetical protein